MPELLDDGSRDKLQPNLDVARGLSSFNRLHRDVITKLQIKQSVSVLISRLVPGALNVLAMLALASSLPRQAYGLASTYIATATATSDLLFGGIIYSTLVHYSEHRARGKHRRYESLHIANTLFLSVMICAGGFGLAWAGILDWRLAAAAVAFGTYTSIQEISHARLEFYRFASGSCAQSLAFLGLAFAIVRPDPTIENALDAFWISYAFGAFISALLLRPQIALPSPTRLRAAFSLGSIPTLSNLCVNIFALGCRYLLLLFGYRDALGVFAFSLDIAQRGVGIFLNLATFALVPHALKRSEEAGVPQLWRTLGRGWMVAVAVSLLGAAVIMAAAATHLFAPLNRPVYDPLSFGLVCVAVIVSRSSKMVLSPVAIRLRRTRLLLTPLIVIAPLALMALAGGLYLRTPYAVEIIYTLAFVAWSASSYRALLSRLRDGTGLLPAGAERF